MASSPFVDDFFRSPGRIAQSLLDVDGIQIRILSDDLVGAQTIGQQIDNERYGNPHPAYAGFSAQYVRIKSNAI